MSNLNGEPQQIFSGKELRARFAYLTEVMKPSHTDDQLEKWLREVRDPHSVEGRKHRESIIRDLVDLKYQRELIYDIFKELAGYPWGTEEATYYEQYKRRRE